jgi:hypothetical protein
MERGRRSTGRNWGQIVVRVGEYRFEELRRWRDMASATLFEIDAVVMLDLDEVRNRIAVGISDPSAQIPAEAILHRIGVPLEAVYFEAANPVSYAIGQAGSWTATTAEGPSELSHVFRPLVGGVMIEAWNAQDSSGRGNCTLGSSPGDRFPLWTRDQRWSPHPIVPT